MVYVGDTPIATLPFKDLPDGRLTAGNLTMNVYTRQVSCGKQFVSLTRTEFDILRVLIENQHQVTPYGMLIDQSNSNNAFHQHLYALRLKLRVAGWDGRLQQLAALVFGSSHDGKTPRSYESGDWE